MARGSQTRDHSPVVYKALLVVWASCSLVNTHPIALPPFGCISPSDSLYNTLHFDTETQPLLEGMRCMLRHT